MGGVYNPPAPGASLTVAETEVFNGTSPAAWADLDLSGTVGANPALVVLKAYPPGSLSKYIAVRKKGDTDEFYAGSDAAGCAWIDTSAQIHFVLVVATDGNGFIQWKTGGAETWTIDVIGYVK